MLVAEVLATKETQVGYVDFGWESHRRNVGGESQVCGSNSDLICNLLKGEIVGDVQKWQEGAGAFRTFFSP
jgi:hypothetical protein